MKATKWFLLGSLALAGCSQEDMTDLADDGNAAAKEGITMTVKDFETDGATRTALTLDEEAGLKFTWAESDLVGVFGSQDDQQVKLTIESGADSNEATFTSNDFQLSTGSQYRAYFPMTDANTASSSAITLDYTGQKQTADASTAHLGAYDFLVSDKVTPTATNTAAFTFSHLNAAVRLKITMPEAGTWTAVKLSADEALFTTAATLDLFGETEFTATAKSRIATLDLADVSTAAGEVLTAWMMLAPADLSGKTITVTVIGSDGAMYTGDITGKNFTAGKAYSLGATTAAHGLFLSGKFQVGTSSYVQFTSGNLQYDIEAGKYRLAANQWEYLSTATGGSSSKATADYFTATDGYITATPDDNSLDLFCYGTGTNPTLASNTSSDYTTFNDWGTTAAAHISGLSGARTLTNPEWLALLQNQYYVLANLQTSDNVSVFGMVVFPYGTDETTANSYVSDATVSKLTTNAVLWPSTGSMTTASLKASGALFLPAAGKTCDGTSAYLAGVQGSYMSSTLHTSATQYGFAFISYMILPSSDDGVETGEAVRLAKDAD